MATQWELADSPAIALASTALGTYPQCRTKRHGGEQSAPQIRGWQGEGEHGAAAWTDRDVQIVPVERMQIIGTQVDSHIVYVETLVELDPYLVFGHQLVRDVRSDRGSGLLA
jgi:hypothetical protein